MAEGQDEARARAVLFEMQERVSRGPHAALGITSHATAADIRTAFLQLTKIYHPARFGRMSTEIQRLSNEVFLSLRAAHDSLEKPRRGPAAIAANTPPPTTRASVSLPSLPRPASWSSLASATTKDPTGQQPVPPARPTAGQRPSSPPHPAERHNTPPTGVRIAAKPSASGSTSSMAPIRSTQTLPALDPQLAPIVELMQRGAWDQARAAIHSLASRAPDSPKYKALIAYTRGREAQLAGGRDEARVELETALQLDPDLQLAKTALGELFTRRK